MPFISDKSKLGDRALKRTAKLLDCQREMVVYWRNEKGYSQRQLAKMFGVSRRTITFILDPKKHEQNLERRKERGGWKQYHSREKQTEAQREHRRYKYKILKETLLTKKQQE